MMVMRFGDGQAGVSIAMAEYFWMIVAAYLAVGALFGVVFVSLGIGRLDPAAMGSGLGFRLLMLPGAVALWPALLLRVLVSPLKKRSGKK